jgi:large subunit ribosomal protein L4
MSFKLTVVDDTLRKKVDGFDMLTDYEVRQQLLAQVIRSEMLNQRSGNAHTKTRDEVRGGGKKPWRQKGTGRARHGSIRSPLWVGGGVTFGPRNVRNWHRKINKTARLSALKSILKDRLAADQVFQLADSFDYPKTKQAIEILEKLTKKTEQQPKAMLLVYTSEDKPNLRGFVSSGVHLLNAHNLKIFKLAQAENLLLTPKAKAHLEERLT